MTPQSSAPLSNALQKQAAYLSSLWNRLSTQHIALGCACLMSGISVSLEDFECDIADYLWAESERWNQADVTHFLLENGPISQQDKAIKHLLQRLEAAESTEKIAQWLLPRLSKTIESYAKLHHPAPQAPMMGGSALWRKSYRT